MQTHMPPMRDHAVRLLPPSTSPVTGQVIPVERLVIVRARRCVTQGPNRTCQSTSLQQVLALSMSRRRKDIPDFLATSNADKKEAPAILGHTIVFCVENFARNAIAG